MLNQFINLTLYKFSFLAFLLSASFPISAWEIDYFVIKDQAEPFQIVDDRSRHSGIVSDIIQEAVRGTEHRVTPHVLPFKRMLAYLENNKSKNWIVYGSPIWAGIQSSNLSSTPIMTVQHSLLTYSDNTFTFDGPDDLEKSHVILLFGFDYPGLERFIQSGIISPIHVKTYKSAFALVESQRPRLAGFVEMDIRIKYNLRKSDRNIDDFRLYSLSEIVPDYGIYLSYSPNLDSEIQQFFDIKLAEMRLNGQLEKIISKYR
ncbi:transporter substrate-binding domain-containing protein [Veronia pacifica]|uniref:Uncharacterized protein n=1 Tax=Veronia pacifica TaxID=1080227 RepID=A0A1C3ES23_9GAMM|nr:transporter substrate-binding domain-containing protein [Veronia pacifica]ODA36043.1 hypothetical protein A8L45_00060 [Veronia pacifica]